MTISSMGFPSSVQARPLRVTFCDELLNLCELVGVAHGIEGNDPPALDRQCGRLQRAPAIEGDEARQPVDRRRLDPARGIPRLGGEAGHEPQDLVAADDWIEMRRLLAASV